MQITHTSGHLIAPWPASWVGCISATVIAGPGAERLLRPELLAIYQKLASGLAALSAELQGVQPGASTAASTATAAGPQLRLMLYSQVAFGRLKRSLQAS